jgi:hypothetical protein
MTNDQTALIISKLDDIQTDVRYLRDCKDEQADEITEIKVDVSSLKTSRSAFKWLVGVFLTVMTLISGIAVAFWG